MTLPTKPPQAITTAGCLLGMLKSYCSTIRHFWPALFESQPSFLVKHYYAQLEQTPPDGTSAQVNDLLPVLRTRFLKQLSARVVNLPDPAIWLLCERRLYLLQRWQAAWALGWCLALPGAYLLWQLGKSLTALLKANAVLIISTLGVILLMTISLALIGFMGWSLLSGPFCRWCKRSFSIPGHLEFLESAQEDER